MDSGLPAQADARPLIADLALSWVDHDLWPRLIVSGRLTVLWGNAAARAALASGRDLEARNGMLTTALGSSHGKLVDFILDSGAAISCCCLPRADGNGHLLLRSQRIWWQGQGAFGLSFVTSGSDFSRRYADLDIAFQLTRSEHEVLMELLDGQEAEKIALRRKVSVDTIRSQVRHIYSKLEVKTREALFRKALPFLL